MQRFFCQLIALVLFLSFYSSAQNVASKKLSAKNKAYTDSLKKVNYNYILPFLGQKVYQRGYDIPYPIGIMVNYFAGNQNILIDNIKVGVRTPNTEIAPQDFSKLISFGNNKASIQTISARADFYLLPFLNIYALGAYIPSASTNVELVKPFSMSSGVNQSGYSGGLGLMLAYGIGPVWVQGDINRVWSNMQLLNNLVATTMAGVRVGHTFPIPNKPQMNFAIWGGAMYMGVNSETNGEVKLGDVLPSISQEKKDEINNNYHQWYDGLNPIEKRVWDEILDGIQEKAEGQPIRNTTILYSLDKRISQSWAGIAGAQFQLNKRWQFRTEWTILGDRFSMMFSTGYRFLGLKKRGSRNSNIPQNLGQ